MKKSWKITAFFYSRLSLGTKIPDSDKCGNCKGEKYEEVKKILEVHIFADTHFL